MPTGPLSWEPSASERLRTRLPSLAFSSVMLLPGVKLLPVLLVTQTWLESAAMPTGSTKPSLVGRTRTRLPSLALSSVTVLPFALATQRPALSPAIARGWLKWSAVAEMIRTRLPSAALISVTESPAALATQTEPLSKASEIGWSKPYLVPEITLTRAPVLVLSSVTELPSRLAIQSRLPFAVAATGALNP